MRVVFDVLPHEEDEYEVVSGPYTSELVAAIVLKKAFRDEKYAAKLGLHLFDPISVRRDSADYWWIVGKPLPRAKTASHRDGLPTQLRTVMP